MYQIRVYQNKFTIQSTVSCRPLAKTNRIPTVDVCSCKAIFTLCRIAFSPSRKLYRMRLLFAHKNKLWRCESVTECISKAESDISDRCSQYARYGFSWRYEKPYPAQCLWVNMPKLRRSCFQQVNIERDFNLRELKKAAEEKQKVREKNAKKEKNKSE